MAQRRKPAPLILANREQHFPLSALSRLLPDRPSYSSLWAWCSIGVNGDDGENVTMEFVWGTNRRCRRSSVEAYLRFVEKVNGYIRE